MAFSAAFIYQIVDKYSPMLDKMRAKTRQFNSDLKTSGTALSNFGIKASKASTALANLRTGFAAAMLTRGVKNVGEEAFKFSEAMNAVKANTQGTVVQMRMLRSEAMRLNAETKFTAIQAAETMAILGRRGLDPSKIKGLMPDILAMATAGRISPEESATLLAGTLKTYAEGVEKAVEFTNIMAFATTSTATDMTQLARAIKNAGGMTSSVGISFKETTAILGVLASKFEVGSSAGTRMSMAIAKLIDPSKEAIETLNKLGIRRGEIFDGKDFKDGGLIRFFELMDEKGATAKDVLTIFTKKSGRMLVKLLGMSDQLRRVRNEMDTTDITTRKMADTMQEGLTGAVYEASSAWINMKVAIGDALGFILIPLLRVVKGFAEWVKLHPGVAKFIGIIMLTGAVLLSMVTIIGVVLASLGSLSILFGTTGAIAATAGAAGAAGFGAMAVAVWAAMAPFLAIAAVIAVIVGVVLLLMGYWENIWGFIKKIGFGIKNLLGFGGADPFSLSDDATRPGDLGTNKSMTSVTVNHTGELIFTNRSGGNVQQGAGGPGMVPINIKQDSGYGYYGGAYM